MSDLPVSETIIRREFLGKFGFGLIGAAGTTGFVDKLLADEAKTKWEPLSDRKIRVGIAGYGMCKFGAAFSFQDHPNVEIVSVTDLIPARRNGLMKACRCANSHESLEKMILDPKIEAVFCATDAPSHARHCIDVLKHGKHVMTAVPAAFGSVEEADSLLETVEKTGLKYMMAETSTFRPDCWAMRQVYRAGGFGRLIYSEGEYYHYSKWRNISRDDPHRHSFNGWRVGLPPMWYPTHSTAYYISVTGKRFTGVSCNGFRGKLAHFQHQNNNYKNPFDSENALFRTSEGGASRMNVCWGIMGAHGEVGRVFGEKGCMNGVEYSGGLESLPDITRPALPASVRAGGHGGSHGRLMHEFITSILEDRQPINNVYESLAMTVPGIIAHQSALKNGELLHIPQYVPPTSG